MSIEKRAVIHGEIERDASEAETLDESRAAGALTRPKDRVPDSAHPDEIRAVLGEFKVDRLLTSGGRKSHHRDNRLHQSPVTMLHVHHAFGAKRREMGAADVGVQRRERVAEDGLVGRRSLRRRKRNTHGAELTADTVGAARVRPAERVEGPLRSSQRIHGRHAHAAPCGQIGRSRRDDEQQRGGCAERQGVERLDLE